MAISHVSVPVASRVPPTLIDNSYSKAMADHASSKIETSDVRQTSAALIRETVPLERIEKPLVLPCSGFVPRGSSGSLRVT